MKSLVVRKNNNQPTMGGFDVEALGAFIDRLQRELMSTVDGRVPYEKVTTALVGQCAVAGYFESRPTYVRSHQHDNMTGTLIEVHVSVNGGADYIVFTGPESMVERMRLELVR